MDAASAGRPVAARPRGGRRLAGWSARIAVAAATVLSFPYAAADPDEALAWMDTLFGLSVAFIVAAVALAFLRGHSALLKVGAGPAVVLPYSARARADLRRRLGGRA